MRALSNGRENTLHIKNPEPPLKTEHASYSNQSRSSVNVNNALKPEWGQREQVA